VDSGFVDGHIQLAGWYCGVGWFDFDGWFDLNFAWYANPDWL
jgi:hypothetical protein